MGRIFGLPPDDLETIRRANSHLQKLFPLFHMAISLWLSAPAASDLHTLLHQCDGSVAACGDNRWGQCNEQRSEQTVAVIFASGLISRYGLRRPPCIHGDFDPPEKREYKARFGHKTRASVSEHRMY